MRIRRAAIVLVAVVVVAAGCGNAGSDDKSSSSTTKGGAAPTKVNEADLKVHNPISETGVTDDEIRVSAVEAITNPLGIDYKAFSNGIDAYFKMVNSKDGLYGRQLKIAAVHDDQLGNNASEVQAALSQDNPFAMFIATSLFTGADTLASEKIPTFGWNVNNEWTGHETFFPNWPAYCFQCATPQVPRIAQQIGAKKVGILAYTASQSTDCADQDEISLKKWPTAKVVFSDRSLAFGVADVSAQVAQMKDKGVDLVLTCMDTNGSFTVAKEMSKVGLKAPMIVPNSYDHAFMQANGKYFDGSYVSVQFTPLETRPQPAEMKTMLSWLKKSDQPATELAVQGWMAANQFVLGLKLAGPNFDRTKVTAALNAQTAFTANGMLPPINWSRDHTSAKDRLQDTSGLDCLSWVQVKDSKFVPAFSEGGKPWACFTVASLDRGSATPTKLPAATNQSFAPAAG